MVLEGQASSGDTITGFGVDGDVEFDITANDDEPPLSPAMGE